MRHNLRQMRLDQHSASDVISPIRQHFRWFYEGGYGHVEQTVCRNDAIARAVGNLRSVPWQRQG